MEEPKESSFISRLNEFKRIAAMNHFLSNLFETDHCSETPRENDPLNSIKNP